MKTCKNCVSFYTDCFGCEPWPEEDGELPCWKPIKHIHHMSSVCKKRDCDIEMKNNLIKITDSMDRVKSMLPEWTWDDIVRCGLSLARLLDCKDNQFKYKQLYWLSKKSIKELSASFR